MCFAVQMSWIESLMLFYWSSWSILFFATIWQTRKFVLIETLWPVLVSSPSQKLSSLWKLPTFSLKPLQVFFSKAASKYKSHTFVAKWSVATLSKHLKYPEINTYWKSQEKKRVLLSWARAFGDIYATCLLPTFMRFEVVLNRHKT